MKSNKKKGRKERKLHSVARNPSGTFITLSISIRAKLEFKMFAGNAAHVRFKDRQTHINGRKKRDMSAWLGVMC